MVRNFRISDHYLKIKEEIYEEKKRLISAFSVLYLDDEFVKWSYGCI